MERKEIFKMKLGEPFKFIFKGKLFPGFTIKVDADPTVKVDGAEIPVSIKDEAIPRLNDIKDVLIEEIKDL